MGSKLFVGSLAWALDDVGLRDAFAPFGAVKEAKVIQDRETGRSRGFGFVTFDREDDAKKALQAMDGALVSGRNINVSEAKERTPGGGGGGGGGFRSGGGGGFDDRRGGYDDRRGGYDDRRRGGDDYDDRRSRRR